MRSGVPVVVLVACLALAGCTVGYQGPIATPTPDGPSPTPDAATPTAEPSPTPTETPSSDDPGEISVSGGELDVKPGTVYDRVAGLLSTTADPPERIRIRPLNGQTQSLPADTTRMAFYDLFGLTTSDENASGSVAAYVAQPSVVNVNSAVLGDPRLESILAHEFVHTVQFRENAIGAVRGAAGYTLDSRLASNGAIEGAAVFGAETYWEQFIETGVRPAEDAAALYRNSTGRGRLTAAAYALGYEHIAARIDDPARLDRIYRDPPTTTEQLLHPGVTDAPRELEASVGETEWLASDTGGRFGELFVRTTLGTELNASAAASGADGWGTDTRLDFLTPEDERGFAWVLRFDDAANTSEFERTAHTWLDERATRDGDGWTSPEGRYRLVPVDSETVVWLAGAETFVEEATATSDDGAVTVSV